MRIYLHPIYLQRSLSLLSVLMQKLHGMKRLQASETCELKLGAHLFIYDQAPKAPRGGAIHHLGIETDDLEDLVLHIRNHGVTLKNEIKEEEKFKYVMIKGPDDLLIELFECKEPERWGIAR
jgi:hypothetical protein